MYIKTEPKMENLQVKRLLLKELKEGMEMLNCGIITAICEYSNCVIIHFYDGSLLSFSKYSGFYIAETTNRTACMVTDDLNHH
jgi:hypothetical protein